MNAAPALGYPGVSLAEPQSSPTAASFGSNNPFRNRALSPSVPAASNSRPERPRSTNPFLDDTDSMSPQSAPGMSTGATMFSPVEKTDISSNTRELFENLSLKPTPQPPRPRPPPSNATHRTPSNRNRPQRPPGRSAEPKEKDPLDIFADPPKLNKAATMGPRDRPSRRPRRNSESSVMDRASTIFDDEDEKRRRERRHRERESRNKDGKSRSTRKDRRLDIIDKLDVTSIYGTGMFHHDGPFDACNPHRNRRGLRTAPMQAFPKGSTNMALGGAGPNNSNIDLNLFHGRMEEGHTDFATAARRNADSGNNFDPTSRVEPVHGSESMGLGTSTFLDGAPASRSAMARRQSENETSIGQNGGLARKKSLAQRLRGRGPGRITSPTDNNYPPPIESSHSASSRGNERNPYFQDDDEEWDKKGASVESRLEGGRLRSSSSPKQNTGLERKATHERAYEESKLNPGGGGGFLNRMKSLRKPKPERRTSD